MAVHSNGLGDGWLETLDIDQVHGLDYREFNDLRIGIRKRLNKEHVACGDVTAGGEHIPGGCAVVDVLDSTSDLTNYMDDGSYTGGGLVWCVSTGAKYGVLWLCATGDGTYGAVGDPTILKLHPDKQWAGGDVTWAGAHEFDGSVDFSGPVLVEGTVNFNGQVDFSMTDYNGPVDLIGAEVTANSAAASLVRDTVYRAQTAGWLEICITGGTGSEVAIKVGDSTNPTSFMRNAPANTGAWNPGISCPVKKDQYVCISANAVPTQIFWVPFGIGGLVAT